MKQVNQFVPTFTLVLMVHVVGQSQNLIANGSFEDANLKKYQDLIVSRMSQHRMPKLGTTIIHKEGLALIRAYVDSFP